MGWFDTHGLCSGWGMVSGRLVKRGMHQCTCSFDLQQEQHGVQIEVQDWPRENWISKYPRFVQVAK